jgi:uncharacterized membrane protein YebE (DUF533 family)
MLKFFKTSSIAFKNGLAAKIAVLSGSGAAATALTYVCYQQYSKMPSSADKPIYQALIETTPKNPSNNMAIKIICVAVISAAGSYFYVYRKRT